MPSVCHLLSTYLFVTGSWIYNQLTHSKAYQPFVLARHTDNLEIFPFEPVFSYMDQQRCSRRFAQLVDFLLPRVSTRVYDLVFYNWMPYENAFYENIIRQLKPVLLHAHFGNIGYRALPLKRKFGLPLVTTFYGYDMSQLPKRDPFWITRYQQLFSEGDVFLVEGTYMRQRLIELGCPPEKVLVQHLGIDLSKLHFQPRMLKENQVRVLFAGSFREKKGLPYAIRAFAKVRERYPNMELVIIGDGNMREELLDLVQDLQLVGCTRFLGYQPYSNFIEELYKAHIFLAPSVTAKDGDTEGGAPVSIIEAQATGMPVLSTYHADIPEVVLDGKSGFLVPERDIESLAQRLSYLVEHPYIWESLGRVGRRHIEQKYNLETQVDKLERIYDDVCKR